MDIFRSGLKTVLGSQQGSNNNNQNEPSGAETVEKLVDRVQTSTLLDDRRDACRALKALSRKYRVEVGAQGMDALLNVLSNDRIDSEIVSYAVESLVNVTSPDPQDDESPDMKFVGEQFTEIFTKKSENVTVLLSLLEEYNFQIRLPIIRLLTNLLVNRPKEIQEILLISPLLGVPKLLDLLADTREIIRNETILLLTALTKSNANIQKIIAFENGFDRILQIIQDEGYSDGGPVVEDCLQLFLNLLKSNTSNQTLFREGNYIKRLVPFFLLPTNEELEFGWATQKVSNIYHMFQIVRTLVTPLNPNNVLIACQKAMKICGILECLCNILMASGVPGETLTECIACLGDVIRGCPENQDHFGNVMAPSEPPRSALIILLMTLVNERQPLNLRCTVFYAIQSFLYKNEKSQEEIVKSLMPASNEALQQGLTAGKLLCSGLFGKDLSSNWFSGLILSHTILENVTQKELLLKVQLATKANSPPTTLLQTIVLTIQSQGIKPQVKIGLLQFLAIWLESCPAALAQFLSNNNSIPYLISQVTSTDSDDKEIIIIGLSAFIMGLCLLFNPNNIENYTKDSLYQLITNRIGIEKLTEGLNNISKSEQYLHSLKHPQLSSKHSSELIFDHGFCVLFKKHEPQIIIELTDPYHQQNHVNNRHSRQSSWQSSRSTPINLPGTTGSGDSPTNIQSSNEVINRYKEVIRNQDIALQTYKNEIHELQRENIQNKGKLDEMEVEILQLKSQLTLAQAQRESSHLKYIPQEEHYSVVFEKDSRIKELEHKVGALENKVGPPLMNNPMQEELISKLEDENKLFVDEVERLKKEQDDLLELLSEQDNKISRSKGYKIRLRQLGEQVEDDDDDDDGDDDDNGEIEQNNGHVNSNPNAYNNHL